jgi:hypothetical protein
MGADSFQADHGVMLSKTKDKDTQPFQWVIDANPQDIKLLDFILPNGTERYITVGDYRQLADALFHAGTRSGSEYEYVDIANRLHFYVIDTARDASGVLHYVVGVRSLDSQRNRKAGVKLNAGVAKHSHHVAGSEWDTLATCSFELKNTGSALRNASAYMQSDVYRFAVEVDGHGWHAELPNALAAVGYGKSATVGVAVGAGRNAAKSAVISLTAISETNSKVKSTKRCKVAR